MMRYYYASSVKEFMLANDILQTLTINSEFDIAQTQRAAWIEEIQCMKNILKEFEHGQIIFEYDIPRLGRRVDIILLLKGLVFTIEFKVGETVIKRHDLEQVWDYALDLKNFQEASHDRTIIPVLVATNSEMTSEELQLSQYNDNVYEPLVANSQTLGTLIQKVLDSLREKHVDLSDDEEDALWVQARYSPTPTIVQAASYMYKHHSVENITRTEASGKNLQETTDFLVDVIRQTKERNEKAICFVTGVPGAGKTLVGLNVAIQQFKGTEEGTDDLAVYLSGNGPLVEVLTEALARDKKQQAVENGEKCNITDARREVKSFIQNIYHYRNDFLSVLKYENGEFVQKNGILQVDEEKYRNASETGFEGVENIAVFDEAQRAWTNEMLAGWLNRRKNISGFPYSEPEFLIWSLNLRNDWAVIVCLVGGGQEINTGEAGITEWVNAVNNTFKDWKIYISPNLKGREYDNGKVEEHLSGNSNVIEDERLHLAVSMRSFRAENLSNTIQEILNLNPQAAKEEYSKIRDKYPIVLTRDLGKAKQWLKDSARGSERYGIVCSSQAYRLRPLAIDVRVNPDTVHWFLDDETDIRSSLFLEDVCTEFQVQGLELDWVCVVWDGDFRYTPQGWNQKEFQSSRWNNINKEERKQYQLNAYRVLLTRARQGMVICVPEGDSADPTRLPEFYDETYQYLKDIGFTVIE